MTTGLAHRRYKSKPLDSWKKAKELRLKYYRDVGEAKEKGKMLVCGGAESFVSLPAGFGPYEWFGGEPYGASMGNVPQFSLPAMEAFEAKGFARDMCGYARNYIGSMFVDRYLFGGPFPKADFCVQMVICDIHHKWYQYVTEYKGIPYFGIELPCAPPGSPQEKEREKFLAQQLSDAIDWMKKVTGKDYDDEKFAEATNNDLRCAALWAEIAIMNQTVPAPLDAKSMYSLYVLGILARYRKECVEFYELLKDEVEDRVKNQIAAVATERYRILHDNFPIWSFLQMYRYLEKYGVACLGSFYCFGLGGALRENKDGVFYAAPFPKKGLIFKNRDEIVGTLAEWYNQHPLGRYMHYHVPRGYAILRIAKQWHANGVMMHLNRGCLGNSPGQMEIRKILLDSGMPVMAYEGNAVDTREVDRGQILDRIDAFMESQGLQKLAD